MILFVDSEKLQWNQCEYMVKDEPECCNVV